MEFNQKMVDVVLKRTGQSRQITEKSYKLNPKAYQIVGQSTPEQPKKSEKVANAKPGRPRKEPLKLENNEG